MSVLGRFAQAVGKEEEARGRACLQNGAVQIEVASEEGITALVRADDGEHRTTLSWASGHRLAFTCTCGAHGRRVVCRHVTATALLAEAEGRLPPGRNETLPRRGAQRSGMWLSPSGELRRLDVDEPRPAIQHQPSPPSWKKQLAKVRDAHDFSGPSALDVWPADRELLYIIDAAASAEQRTLVVRLACRDRRQNGQWSRPKIRGVSFPSAADLPNRDDRQVMALLKGAGGGHPQNYDPVHNISTGMRQMLVELMCRTGRTVLVRDSDADEMHPLAWDDAGPWQFCLECRRDESTQHYVFSGWLVRRDQRMPLARPALLLPGGVVFCKDTAAALDDRGDLAWAMLLRQQRTMTVPFAQAEELLSELLSMPNLPRLELPDDLRVQEVHAAPKPRLRVRAPRAEELRPQRLRADLSFDYDGTIVPLDRSSSRRVFDAPHRRLIIRDESAERKAVERLAKLGVREALGYSTLLREFWFSRRHLLRLVRVLVNEGWHVEAEGKLYRRAGAVKIRVSSGVDWFELHGDIDFEGKAAKLPQLLAALKRGETTVLLDDGTLGILPEQWLRKYGLMVGIGQDQGDFIQFSRAQVGLLDVLLTAQEDASCDEVFERTRQELRQFAGIRPQAEPPGFVGELRPYQRDGLGWFEFLRRFSFGGCLADDMGLGKTVQVLALLEQRRELRQQEQAKNDPGQKTMPSLVIVPKSLVFNWIAEASRFAPGLRVLDHTGIERAREGQHLMDCDVVITTYGTLRRDVEFLKDVQFDYMVLDEAQAVKNPASESAKAVRLVQGNHRLALSGTPVQNHLGDLWSLFDFLNPGMLGSASVFVGAGGAMRNPDPETRAVLAKALRPFILRRTKQQVAGDLPARLEQTIYCEMDEQQRKLYDEMKNYYRQSLLERVDRDGMGKSQMHILEALLRLRQAALHPGLLDASRVHESSAKLDVLLPQLHEVMEEGHKALVFSQFTSMLAIVRQRLDEEKVLYEYLDGKTRDRADRVERFQTDAKCRLFLISLKAGGLGLNLTAADYVFLLDPWWNPAIEAQAIDRTHRIGQTRQVYACRLIARGTVEEKVLELQKTKRDLADAIITADNSLIRSLGREELEMLLA